MAKRKKPVTRFLVQEKTQKNAKKKEIKLGARDTSDTNRIARFIINLRNKVVSNRIISVLRFASIISIVISFVFIYAFLIQIDKNTLFSIRSQFVTHPFPALSQLPAINSAAFTIYEPESRVFVAGKNDTFRFTPASTVKIMTALVALEYYPLDLALSAQNLDSVEGSKMGLIEGERITVNDLLYGLLLPSGNDAAHVLASNYPGGKEAFIARMNSLARELKLFNTHFVDISGYDDNNYTTAQDLARLATHAMKSSVFREIVRTKEKVIFATKETSDSTTLKLENLNKLLSLPGVVGVKTGFTEEAGEVLVSSLAHEGKNYIVVVLKSRDRFGDSSALMRTITQDVRFISFKSFE